MPNQLFASQQSTLSLSLFTCLFMLCFVFVQFSFSLLLNFTAYLTVSTFNRDRTEIERGRQRAETSFLACCIHISCGLLLPGLEIGSLARLRLGNETQRKRERERAGETLITIETTAKIQQIFIVFFYCTLLYDLLFVTWVDPTEFNTIN